MENQKDPLLSRDEDLTAENNVLKMKLKLEHDMLMEDTSTLTPDVENQWLKSVYAFEQQFKDARRIKLYDYIGRPAFLRWDTLSPGQASRELTRIRSIMSSNNLELDCVCQYDDALIYKFVTEELFEHEIDDMRIPGMTYHFIYEEFHPNHDHDVRQHSADFVERIFSRPWNEEFDVITLAPNVLFSGQKYDHAGITAIIKTFQEAHASLSFDKFEINEVAIEPGLTHADVRGTLGASGKTKGGERIRYDGICTFHFTRDDDYWGIAGFSIPGFTGANA